MDEARSLAQPLGGRVGRSDCAGAARIATSLVTRLQDLAYWLGRNSGQTRVLPFIEPCHVRRTVLPMDDSSLSEQDIRWANDLASMMVTAAVIVAESSDEEASPVYATARQAALEVNMADGRGADRWLQVMFTLAERAAECLTLEANQAGTDVSLLWKKHTL